MEVRRYAFEREPRISESSMAKERPDNDTNCRPPKPEAPSPLPHDFLPLAGIAFATLQPDLFSGNLGDPGANTEFVSRVFATALPLVEELGLETVRRIPPDSGMRLQINQLTTAALVALQVVVTKPLGFTESDTSICTTLGARPSCRMPRRPPSHAG